MTVLMLISIADKTPSIACIRLHGEDWIFNWRSINKYLIYVSKEWKVERYLTNKKF